MTFNSPNLFIEIFLFLILVFPMIIIFFNSRKRSAENIYKLIDELEKKLHA